MKGTKFHSSSNVKSWIIAPYQRYQVQFLGKIDNMKILLGACYFLAAQVYDKYVWFKSRMG